MTSDKDGPNSRLAKEIVDAEVVISQPFWPAYATAELIAKAPKLKLIVTAGIGSDHTDLQAAMNRGITVAEVTYCNSISVSEHVVMMILSLVRNYIPSHDWVVKGGWNIADCVERSYDVEGMQRRHGGGGPHRARGAAPHEAVRREAALHRPAPAAGVGRAGTRPHVPPRTSSRWCGSATSSRSTARCIPETEGMFNDALIAKMKRGAYIVNTARGKICDRDAIVRALKSGQLAGYAGDVWFPQPPPRNHPWRTMPHEGMTPHISGSSLSAQARYAAGTREILECWFDRRPIRNEYLIVDRGQLAGHRQALLQRGQCDARFGGGGQVQGGAEEVGGQEPRPGRRRRRSRSRRRGRRSERPAPRLREAIDPMTAAPELLSRHGRSAAR